MQCITISPQLILCMCSYAYAPCVFTSLLLFVYASACVVEKRDFLLYYFLVLLHWTLTTESLFWLLKSGEPSGSVHRPGMRNFNKNKQINTNPCQQLIWKNMRLNVNSCITNTNLLNIFQTNLGQDYTIRSDLLTLFTYQSTITTFCMSASFITYLGFFSGLEKQYLCWEGQIPWSTHQQVRKLCSGQENLE